MLRVLAAVLAALFSITAVKAETEWRVGPSEGLDAVLLAGAMSGDKLQARYYEDDIARYRAKMTPEELAALGRIGAYYAEPGRGLAGPSFAFYLAAVEHQSLQAVVGALDDPQHVVMLSGELAGDSSYGAQRFIENAKDYRTVLVGLKREGFAEYWRAERQPELDERAKEIENFVTPYDLIPLDEKYLGRDLEDEIEIIVLYYNKPYGIRVAGQRFVTNVGWDMTTTLRTAAHELFHPPFRLKNEELRAAASELENSPLMTNILKNADPKYGYSNFEGVLNEDSTQALDKIVSEALGFAPDVADYWRQQDEGMHLLAAALYDAMKETGFAQSGGVYEEWLIGALRNGTLSPAEVERRARKVVGDEAVDKWAP